MPKTNVISERDFAKLDRLLHEKPNATTLCLEGMILFANNQTSHWLDSKSVEEKQDLLKKARSLAPEFKQLYIQVVKRKIVRRAFQNVTSKTVTTRTDAAKETKRKRTIDRKHYSIWFVAV